MPLFTPASLGFITPEMPTLVPEPPSGEGWIHEIKHDGYRTLILIDRRKVRALSRHGRDWTGGRRQALLQSCHSRWRDHPRSPIQFSDHADCDGALFFKHAAELGLEGIVSKRAKSLRHATAECKLADNLRCPYKLVSIRWLRRGAPTLATSNARIVLNKRRVNALAMFSSMEWSIGFRWLE